jgi:hypothetical protein
MFARLSALALLIALFVPSIAYAACSSPAGVSGQQTYNTTYSVMQFCNGTNWISMAGGAGDNLGVGGTTTGTLYSKNGSYGYVGLDGNDFIRFDDNGQAYWQINGTWEYTAQPSFFGAYANNLNDLGTTSVRWKDGFFAGSVYAGANAHLEARYTTNETYKSSMGWNHLQLGNNGGNYIIGGRTAAGGGLTFVVNNTADYKYGVTAHNGTEAMTITSAGNVGIGAAPGNNKLYVYTGSGYPAIIASSNASGVGLQAYSYGSNAIVGETSAASANYAIFGRPGHASYGGVIGYTQDSAIYGILGHANAYSLYGNGQVYASGVIQSGASVRGPLFYDSQNTSYYVDPASTSLLYTLYSYYYYYNSDEKLKKNIETVPAERVDDVYKLRGVEFDWKENGDHDIGFIAQEVEKLYPELVSEQKNPQTGETSKGVKYANIVALLVEAVKQQKTTNDAQAAEIAALRSHLATSPAVPASTPAPRAKTELPAPVLPPAIDAERLGFAKDAKTCRAVSAPACLQDKPSDPATSTCGVELDRYIFEARVHALCIRGDEKAHAAFAKTYTDVLAGAAKLGLKPTDADLARVTERHAVALNGALTSTPPAVLADKPVSPVVGQDKTVPLATAPGVQPAPVPGEPSLPAWLLALIAFNTIVALGLLGFILTRREAA